VRVFIAVDLAESIRARIGDAMAGLRRRAPDAKWQRTEAMHVTLAFLGEIDEAAAPAYVEAMARAGERHAPLTLAAGRGGTFGRPSHPHVLWVDLAGDRDALSALQRDLVGELVQLGHEPEERAFSPHLTLARARGPRGEPAFVPCVTALSEADFGACAVTELVLYRSDPGSVYTRLAAAPLTRKR
jgi:2'-5' RNA ligase